MIQRSIKACKLNWFIHLNEMTTASKAEVRKKYRQICQKISKEARVFAADQAKQILLQEAIFKKSTHIACYLSFQDELNTAPLIESIWQANKKCYVPVLAEKEHKVLQFVLYHYGDPLHKNRYSILEPVHKAKVIPVEELDLVITPLVAFDRRGHRLGAGGGFYDKTFAFLQEQKKKTPKLIGFAYAAQEAEELIKDPWDIHLDGIVTEKEFITVDE